MGDLMEKSHPDLNAEDLVDASEHLGTVGWQETANAALREIAAMSRRRRAIEELSAMAAAGDFDLLSDERDYRR